MSKNKNVFFKNIKKLNDNQRYLYNKKELYYYEEDKIIKGLSNVNNSWYKDFFLLESDEMDRLLRLIESTDFGKIKKIPLSTYDNSKKLLIFDNNQVKAINILKQEIIELSEREKAFAYQQLYNNALLKDEDVITLLENSLIDKICYSINLNNRNLLVVLDSRFKYKCFEDKKIIKLTDEEEAEIIKITRIKNSSLKHYKNNVVRGNLVRSYIKNNKDEYIVFGNKQNQVLKREEFKNEDFLDRNHYYYINNKIIKTKDYYVKVQNTFEYSRVEYVVYNKNSNYNQVTAIKFPAFSSIKTEKLNEIINEVLKGNKSILDWNKKEIEIPGVEIKKNNLYYFSLKKVIGDFYYYKEYEIEELKFLKNVNIVGYDNKIYLVSYNSDFNPTNEITPELLEKAELETQSIILGASI